MRTPLAAAGSALFLLLAPGVVAGMAPWWITGWRRGEPWLPAAGDLAARAAGALLIVAGAGALLHAFARFALEGRGTPAPVAPTERLVVGGLYRHVRNPMYLAVVSIIVGQALLLARPVLLAYAGVILVAFVAFVAGYEEPTLRARYGAEYDAYCRAVPGWWPRWRGWRSEGP